MPQARSPLRSSRRSKPLRVLMVTSDWPTPGVPRSTPFIRRQAEFVQRAGVDVEVFPFHGDKNPCNYLRAWAQLRRQLREHRYDLIHAQFGQSGLLAFPKRIPLVVTFRGSDVLGIVGNGNGLYTRAGRWLQRASRLVAQHADAVIVVSAHLADHLPPLVPVHVIPSGLDLSLFRPMPQGEARRLLGIEETERVVLFVGRPEQARKRFELARAAVDLLNQRLPARLVVAWRVQHADVPVYMNACDALVFTSMQEGSPNVVKEALACNLPVVSVKVGDVEERLQGVEGCELCADERATTIALALERALLRGRRIDGQPAVRHLDEALLTKKVIQVYQSVLS